MHHPTDRIAHITAFVTPVVVCICSFNVTDELQNLRQQEKLESGPGFVNGLSYFSFQPVLQTLYQR